MRILNNSFFWKILLKISEQWILNEIFFDFFLIIQQDVGGSAENLWFCVKFSTEVRRQKFTKNQDSESFFFNLCISSSVKLDPSGQPCTKNKRQKLTGNGSMISSNLNMCQNTWISHITIPPISWKILVTKRIPNEIFHQIKIQAKTTVKKLHPKTKPSIWRGVNYYPIKNNFIVKSTISLRTKKKQQKTVKSATDNFLCLLKSIKVMWNDTKKGNFLVANK